MISYERKSVWRPVSIKCQCGQTFNSAQDAVQHDRYAHHPLRRWSREAARVQQQAKLGVVRRAAGALRAVGAWAAAD